MLNQWKIEDSIVISRYVSSKAGFVVLHFEKIITTCLGVGTALEGGFHMWERQVLVCCIQLS